MIARAEQGASADRGCPVTEIAEITDPNDNFDRKWPGALMWGA
jgi:hypothetical protein